MPESKASRESAGQQQQRSNGPETGAPADAKTGGESQPVKSKAQRLAELFGESERTDDEAAGGESQDGGDNKQGSETGQQKGQAGESQKKPPKALNDVAERLGVTLDALYALEIPMPNGKPLTLSKLKDSAAAQGDFAVRELAWEERRAKAEGDLMAAQQEVRELLQALPKDAVKPEVLDTVKKRHEKRVALERKRTLEAIPDWSDDERRAADMAGMIEHLKGYGFPVNYLESIYDHRTVKYIRENWMRQQRIQKALEQIETETPETPARSRSNNGRPASKPANVQPTRRGPQSERSRILAILDK